MNEIMRKKLFYFDSFAIHSADVAHQYLPSCQVSQGSDLDYDFGSLSKLENFIIEDTLITINL